MFILIEEKFFNWSSITSLCAIVLIRPCNFDFKVKQAYWFTILDNDLKICCFLSLLALFPYHWGDSFRRSQKSVKLLWKTLGNLKLDNNLSSPLDHVWRIRKLICPLLLTKVISFPSWSPEDKLVSVYHSKNYGYTDITVDTQIPW